MNANVNASSLVHNIETHACLDILPTRASMIDTIDNYTQSLRCLIMCECNVNVSSLVHNIETHACLDISHTRASMIDIINIIHITFSMRM